MTMEIFESVVVGANNMEVRRFNGHDELSQPQSHLFHQPSVPVEYVVDRNAVAELPRAAHPHLAIRGNQRRAHPREGGLDGLKFRVG